ncbi:cytochrome P450 family protein [Rhizoctonia solani]|uniref:Cytochrome P450 family protein n=1 Tax=Rhizoctonia solani TaxID=456999 RepID=A0A8H8NP28_9AGAM|nr:cytochrome P450 family protein [Rhizoctonia solani]QRW16192.1 cytochrome P450 family protein [Rhizoctonia solani]
MFRMSFFTYLAVIASIYVVVTLLRKWRRAWAYRGLAHLPGPPREKWSKGHIPNLYNPNTAFAFHDSLSKYGPVAKIYGIFGNLRLYINDPYAMGEVLLKEENGWERTESYTANLNMVLGPGLLATRGAKHKAQRKFSIHPLSAQVSILVEAHTELTRIEMFFSAYSAAYASRSISQAGIEREIKEQGTNAISVDIFGWAHRSALDAIGLGSMGHDFQTLSGVESDYSKAIKHLLPALFSLAILRPIMPTLYKIGPAWFRRAIITRVPSKAIKQLLSIVDIQYEQALRIFSQRRAALTDSKHGHHNLSSAQKDVVTLILQANGKADPRDRISEEEMLGQLNTLIFAGHDTTSGALACIFQMLAEHPEIQSKLREELLKCSDEDPDYVTLKSFPLLDAVIRETLRLHPPVTIVERVSSRDTVLPLRAPMGVDAEGRPCTALAVPAGTLVMVGLRAANRDPQPGVLTLTNGIHVDGLSRSRQEWPTPESQRPDD